MMKRSDFDHLAFDGKKMEDSFFIQQDKALIERQKALRKMKEDREALAAASGIRNETVLQKLVELEVRPETLAPLSIIPLIEVAWADGEVSKKEEAAVLAGAEAAGIKKDSMEYDLLRHWLAQRPPRSMLEAWIHYVRGIGEKMTPQEKEELKKELLARARRVAEASGGVLGMGAVSDEEKAMLSEMEKAFGA
jgi:hypothetical protein